MKIYVVDHENIVCPKEYRKVEIMEEDVEGYIKRSVAYQDMLETLPDMSSIGPVEEEFYVDFISNFLRGIKSVRKKGIKSPFICSFLTALSLLFQH